MLSVSSPSRCLLLALEPRLLFDGAAAATGDAVMPSADAAGIHDPGSDPAAGEAPARPAETRAANTGAATPAVLDAGVEAGDGLVDALPPVAIALHKGAFVDGPALEAAVRQGPAAVGAADAAGVDAADAVHYAVTINNQGTQSAFDLQVRDQLPPGIDAASVGQLRLIGADGKVIDYRGGDVLRNAATGQAIGSEAAFAEALFSDGGVEFVDPGAGVGFLGGRGDTGRPSGFTIAYQVTLPGTVVAGAEICNSASILQVAPAECGINLVDPCDPPGDGATVTIEAAGLETRLIGTSQRHTDGADAVVGEILTYETIITLPQGRSPDAVLTQSLDPGLSLVSVDSIAYSDGVVADAAPDPAAIVPDTYDGGEANRFVVAFGDIGNRNRDDCATATVTVTWRAVTGNVLANQAGRELVVTAGYRSSGGEPDGCSAGCAADSATGVEVVARSEAATVVEPVLEVTVLPDGGRVEPGGTAEFIVTVSNDSRVDAFDVTVDDLVLPAGLELAPGSAQDPTGGPLVAVLPAGERISFRLVTQVAAQAPPGQELVVDVAVRFTSLPDSAAACGDGAAGSGSRDLSPFVTASDRERTGDDGPLGLDDYVASDRGRLVPVVIAAPPASPPPAPSPSASPPPASPPPGLPIGMPPPDGPLPPGPAVPARAGTGLLPEDRWSPPSPPPLADLLPRGWAVSSLSTAAPAGRVLLGLPATDGLPPGPFEAHWPDDAGADAVLPAAAAEQPVAPDDDCIPAQPPAPRPEAAKRSVFADGPAKPRNRSFSEQVESARKRVTPPAVVRPQPADDC